MGTLIYSEQSNSHVGLPPILINGVQEHYRNYKANGHYIYIDGLDENLIYHDVKQILKLKGFRLAEPEEQNAYFAPKDSHVIHEEEDSVLPLLEEDISPKRPYKKRG